MIPQQFDVEQAKHKLKEFLGEGLYLPEFMRDYKTRILLIERIKDMLDNADPMKDMSVNDLHRLIINKFLWFMAAHGYSLQETRTKAVFFDINATMYDYMKKKGL